MLPGGKENTPGGRVNKISNRDGRAKPIGPASRQRLDSLTDQRRKTHKRVPARAGSRTNRAEPSNNKAGRMRSRGSRMFRVSLPYSSNPPYKLVPGSAAPRSRA